MAKYYTAEKAKFGGTTGMIMPYTRQMPTTNLPDQGNWKTYLPAGYLRCDGSIYKADLFPALASVIGVGTSCKFAKNTTLAADAIQLPDLGSKYIRCSNSSGQYLNVNLNQDPTLSKVGAEIEIDSLVGDSVDISYSGTFKVIGQSGKTFLGNPFFVGDNSGYTANSILTEDEFQAHGHDADVGVFTYLGKWKDSAWVDVGENGGNNGSTEGSNNLVQIDGPSSSSTSPTHNHQLTLPASAALKTGTTFNYGFNDTEIPADGIKSTITVTTENINKLDNAIAPYILVEYIIKI
jgi:hypothetical protein